MRTLTTRRQRSLAFSIGLLLVVYTLTWGGRATAQRNDLRTYYNCMRFEKHFATSVVFKLGTFSVMGRDGTPRPATSRERETAKGEVADVVARHCPRVSARWVAQSVKMPAFALDGIAVIDPPDGRDDEEEDMHGRIRWSLTPPGSTVRVVDVQSVYFQQGQQVAQLRRVRFSPELIFSHVNRLGSGEPPSEGVEETCRRYSRASGRALTIGVPGPIKRRGRPPIPPRQLRDVVQRICGPETAIFFSPGAREHPVQVLSFSLEERARYGDDHPNPLLRREQLRRVTWKVQFSRGETHEYSGIVSSWSEHVAPKERVLIEGLLKSVAELDRD